MDVTKFTMAFCQKLFYLLTLIFIYKTKHQLVTLYLLDTINYNFNYHNYNTRNRSNFHIPQVASKHSQDSVFFKGLQAFNDLPIELRNMSPHLIPSNID